MVRALAPRSHKCVVRAQILALTPLRVVLLLVLPFAPRGFSLGTPIFRSPKKPAFPNSNSNVNGGGRTSIYVDVNTSKSLFTTSKLLIIIYSFIYLFIYLFTVSLPAAGKCDWNRRGTCTNTHDECPPNWERCPQYEDDCPLATDHCCCLKKQGAESVPQLPVLSLMKKDGNTLI